MDTSAPSPSAAPLASRLLAGGCDLVVLLLVALGFLVAGQVVMDGHLGLPSIDQFYLLSIPYFLIIFFLCFAYFTVCHFLWGETPGKMLLGIRVEALTEPSISLSQAFLRSVGGLMGLVPLGLGYAAALFDDNLRGWNDRMAGTWVVLSRDTDADESEASQAEVETGA